MGEKNFTASDFIVGGQSEPGTEMFGGFPLGHIRADIGNDILDGGCIKPIDLDQVNTADAVELSSEIKGGSIFGLLVDITL